MKALSLLHANGMHILTLSQTTRTILGSGWMWVCPVGSDVQICFTAQYDSHFTLNFFHQLPDIYIQTFFIFCLGCTYLMSYCENLHFYNIFCLKHICFSTFFAIILNYFPLSLFNLFYFDVTLAPSTFLNASVCHGGPVNTRSLQWSTKWLMGL